MEQTMQQDAVHRSRITLLGNVLLWIARTMVIAGWLLVLVTSLANQGITALLEWYVLAAGFALFACFWRPLVGGLLLIAFCLSYGAYVTVSSWQQEEHSDGWLLAGIITGFGNIYILVAYLTILLPGILLIIGWRLGHTAGGRTRQP